MQPLYVYIQYLDCPAANKETNDALDTTIVSFTQAFYGHKLNNYPCRNLYTTIASKFLLNYDNKNNYKKHSLKHRVCLNFKVQVI